MHGFFQGFRQSFRRILKTPGFTFVVALTLALGIGANAAILSVVNGVLLQPLPYKDPDGLVTVYHHYPSFDDLKAPVSAPGFQRYHERNSVFEGTSVRTGRSYTLTGRGDPERVSVDLVSGEYFQTMGISPAQGRHLDPGDDQSGRDRVVVLNYGFWQRVFGGDPSAVGDQLVLDGESYDIVGIMPAEFRSFFNRNAELWAPLALTPEQLSSGGEYLTLVARLKGGVSLQQAKADFALLTQGVQEEFPNRYTPAWNLMVVPLNEIARGDIRSQLLMLAGAVALVLLIACANVANLFLARSASRQREVAVYQALGASRGRIVGQLLSESLILAAIGGIVGLVLAYVGMRVFVAATVAEFAHKVAFDASVAVMTTAVTLIAALCAGVAPALLSIGHDLTGPLREGSRGGGDRGGQILRRGLIVAEMALALVLLVGSGLLVRSFLVIQDVDPGFRSEHLLTGRVALPQAKYGEAEGQAAFFDEVLERASALPGITAAGGTSVLPFGGNWLTTSVRIEGYEPPPNAVGPWGDVRRVTPDFLTAIGASLHKGRLFSSADGADAPRVALIDTEFARRYFSDQDPVGKRISFDFGDEPAYIDIVGVVGHTMHEGLDADARIQVYLPFSQSPRGSLSLAVRTEGEPIQAAAGLRHILRSIDADVPLSDVKTMEQRVAESLGSRRFTMLLLGVFSVLALLLSAVGIYGVMSYAVTQRTREMGLRLALGADQIRVLGLVLRQGLTLALIGTAIGLTGAFFLTRLMASQLFGVAATDLSTFLSVPLVLLASAAVATLVPALRATRCDPAVVLREE